MDDLFLLSEAQMRRIKPHFPQSHGVRRQSFSDRRVYLTRGINNLISKLRGQL
jgi:hypothetical protein